jgi:hypothetical protein
MGDEDKESDVFGLRVRQCVIFCYTIVYVYPRDLYGYPIIINILDYLRIGPLPLLTPSRVHGF